MWVGILDCYHDLVDMVYEKLCLDYRLIQPVETTSNTPSQAQAVQYYYLSSVPLLGLKLIN